MTGYDGYTYIVHDTLSQGLTLVDYVDGRNGTIPAGKGKIWFKIGNHSTFSFTTDEIAKILKLTETTVDKTTQLKMEFDLKAAMDITKNAISPIKFGDDINIGYMVELNTDAIIGAAGNPNEVYLEYSNNPYDDDSTKETPKNVATVYTYDMGIFKYDINGDPLKGVKFNLFARIFTYIPPMMETSVDIVSDTPLKFTYDPVAKVYRVDPNGTADLVTGDDGKIHIDGLGTYLTSDELILDATFDQLLKERGYVLKEVEPPEGYDAIEDIEFTLKDGNNDHTTEITLDETHENANVNTNLVNEVQLGENVITVLNTVNGIFPDTGGVGTTMFTLGGLSTMLAAAVLLAIKKKRDAKAADNN
jgi:LPXTG-motif cell wall-anchored protein